MNAGELFVASVDISMVIVHSLTAFSMSTQNFWWCSFLTLQLFSISLFFFSLSHSHCSMLSNHLTLLFVEQCNAHISKCHLKASHPFASLCTVLFVSLWFGWFLFVTQRVTFDASGESMPVSTETSALVFSPFMFAYYCFYFSSQFPSAMHFPYVTQYRMYTCRLFGTMLCNPISHLKCLRKFSHEKHH